MAENERYAVGGSVIQRSFIPPRLTTVLYAASAPLTELCGVGRDAERTDLRRIVGDVLGIPEESIIDDREYGHLAQAVASGDLPRYPNRWVDSPWSRDIHEHWLMTMAQREMVERPAVALAVDSLYLMTNPNAQLAAGPWGLRSIMGVGPTALNTPSGNSLLYPEAAGAGLACLEASSRPDPRTQAFVRRLGDYHIPIGQSPETESESLLRLIETSKKVCLAPLAAGGTIGISYLGQGAFVTALLSTGTGAAMTIILIGTPSVGDLLVRYMMHRRPADERRG